MGPLKEDYLERLGCLENQVRVVLRLLRQKDRYRGCGQQGADEPGWWLALTHSETRRQMSDAGWQRAEPKTATREPSLCG